MSTVAIFACNKEPFLVQDKAPQITLLTPLSEISYRILAADSIEVSFLLSDDRQLSQMSLQIMDAQGRSVFTRQEQLSDALFTFHQLIPFAAEQSLQRYMVYISTEDDNHNAVTKAIVFYVQP